MNFNTNLVFIQLFFGLLKSILPSRIWTSIFSKYFSTLKIEFLRCHCVNKTVVIHIKKVSVTEFHRVSTIWIQFLFSYYVHDWSLREPFRFSNMETMKLNFSLLSECNCHTWYAGQHLFADTVFLWWNWWTNCYHSIQLFQYFLWDIRTSL